MPTTPMFPSHLLNSSDKDRLSYYVNEVIVDHPILTDTLNTLDESANPFLEKRLILLVGGSGVGKTALMNRLVHRRVARMKKLIVENPQIVPAIFVEVEAPDDGKFLFSSLYREALTQMNAALIERTLPLVERRINERLITTIAIEKSGLRLNPSALKARFLENLVERQVDMLCIDEAINIFKVGRPKSEKDRTAQLKDQTDKLKTSVNKTPTSLILCGAYDFLDLTMTSGQIARRSLIIHMSPYTMKDGLEGFATALVGLFGHLPTEHQLDPKEHATELFLQCLGCIGILKNILSKALLHSLTLKTALTINLVRKSYLTASQLEVIRNEMSDGISKVQELMTMEQLAAKAEQAAPTHDKSASVQSKKLAPGETTPSHRHDATKSWSE